MLCTIKLFIPSYIPILLYHMDNIVSSMLSPNVNTLDSSRLDDVSNIMISGMLLSMYVSYYNTSVRER